MIAISVYTAAAAGLLWWFEGLPPAARIPIALPVLLFAPGYAVVTALFPPSGAGASDARSERGILAVVASIVVVAIVAYAVTLATGLELGLVLAGIAAITIVASAVAILRDQSAAPGASRTSRPQEPGEGAGGRSLTDGVTLLAVTIAALLLVASAAVAYTGTDDGQPMTEFYVAGETVTAGDSSQPAEVEYDLRIKHHADVTQEYTMVVVRDVAGSDAADQERSEVDRSTVTVGPDETAAVTHRVSGAEGATNATVRFLLYVDAAPSSPDAETAHRVLELSIAAPSE